MSKESVTEKALTKNNATSSGNIMSEDPSIKQFKVSFLKCSIISMICIAKSARTLASECRD